MVEKKIYIAAVVAIFLVVGVVVWGMNQPEKSNAPAIEKFGPAQSAGQPDQAGEIVYYYRSDCSHCAELSKFIDDNKIADKVAFVKKEIHDQANSAEMQKRANECGIPESQLGVPFIYGKGKCYIGTPQAEDFFKQAAGMQ